MNPEIHIGTSGWHYPHWRGVFYPARLPASQWLGFYAKHFGSVELNSTFYRLPDRRTVEQWRDSVPQDFVFAIKASRFITHRKKLLDPAPHLAKLQAALRGFGHKLGPVLFQLPPHWRVNPARLETFLDALPDGFDYAFELRDPSWHCAAIYSLLRARNAAFCIFDIGSFRSPLMVTADMAYLRLHGPGAPYCGSYAARALREWAAWIRERKELRRVYVYFDNDEAGYAVRNALELRKMLGETA